MFPNTYKAISKDIFSSGKYKLVPIRYKDRLDIMKWRNEQIYHLRQSKPLTEDNQNHYFNNVVSKLFDDEYPNQLLFSYLEEDTCIGYGGLVHIDWNNKNAEISFVMNTSMEKDYFVSHWCTYLQMIEEVAFVELQLHKIYIYAYNLRPRLYEAAEKQGFYKEAILRDHVFFNEEYIDVVIHSKINH